MRLQGSKVNVPVQYLVLDGAGAILLGLGLAKILAGVDVLPPAMRFEDYGMTFVAGGILLMLPMVFYMIGKAREAHNRRSR